MKKHLGYVALALLPFLPLLLGCPQPLPRGASRPPNPADLRVIDLVIAESAARGFDVSGRCADERRDRIAVIDADDERPCGGASGSARRAPMGATPPRGCRIRIATSRARLGCLLGICSAGSVAHSQDSIWPTNLGRWRMDIYVSAYLDRETRRAALTHEAAHAVSACAGQGEDGQHSNALLWGAGGVVESVQAALAAESPR